MSLRFPDPLRPGDVVAVVAPSSPFGREEFDRGVAWLSERYDVRCDEGVFSRTGYLAGSDGRRAAELAQAMGDQSVRAILVARGGYGAMRLLDALPWKLWAERPSWIVGFSDATALHASAWARGVASIHGPNVTGLGRDDAGLASLRDAFRAALESPNVPRTWQGLSVVHRAVGSATGAILGGNLALLEAMAAAGRLIIPDGAVLALEDVTERPYRVDRMLTSLRLGGHLARLSAIVFGDFEKCDPGPDGVRIEEVLAERTLDLGIPVLVGAPFGHATRNEAFVLGGLVRVENGTLVRFSGEAAASGR